MISQSILHSNNSSSLPRFLVYLRLNIVIAGLPENPALRLRFVLKGSKESALSLLLLKYISEFSGA